MPVSRSIYNSSLIVLSALTVGLLSSCSKNSAIDDLLADSQPSVVVAVPPPLNLQVTISSPAIDGRNVGYQVSMTGTCTLPGATVEFRGGATGSSECLANSTWVADVDVSAAPVGNITVEAYLVSGDQESGAATRIFNKTNSDCDSAVNRAATYAAGDGVATPYSICTFSQFNNIRLNPTSDFALKNDIDMQAFLFTPIPNTFAGTFDGGNFVLSGLYIYDLANTDIGLFKALRDGAIVRDLTIENASVSGSSVTGIIAGRIMGTGATIENLTVSGQAAATTDYIGGLVGYVNAAATLTVTNVDVTLTVLTGRSYGGGILAGSNVAAGAISIDGATISGSITLSNNFAGGIAGYLLSPNITLNNVSSSADITINGGVADNYLGGIVGAMTNSTNNNITTCSSSGVISATGSYVGGVAGQFAGTKIWNCEVTSPVSASSAPRVVSYVGGLMGYASGNTTDIYQSNVQVNISISGTNVGNYYGGLVGRFSGTSIVESDAHGDLTAPTNGTLSINTGNGTTTGSSYIGGAFGRIDIANGIMLTINDSNASIDVTNVGAAQDSYLGGYVGNLVTPDGASASIGNISNSLASGNIVGQNRSVGGWAGQIYVSRSGSNISLTNVGASGNVTVTSQNNVTPQYIGGLVGYASSRDAPDAQTPPLGHQWTKVYATGNVDVDSGAVGGNYVGGLVGYFYTGRTTPGGGSSTISHAYATGTVSARSTLTNFSYIGGLIGQVQAAQGATVLIDSTGGQTYATGNVTADGLQVGGLIGYVITFTDADFTLTDAYSNGTVSGRQNVGGAIGYLVNGGGTATMVISDLQSHDSQPATAANTVSASVNSAGGLVGRAESTNTGFLLSNCDAIAAVTSASGYAGGLIGQDRLNVDITNCTATGNVISPHPYVGGLTGGSDQTGRDFTNVEASGNVTASVNGVGATDLYVGGLSGYLRGTITQGRAQGDVLVTLSPGSTIINAYVGGLVGYGNSLAVTQSYARGAVSFDTLGAGTQNYVGGLIGNMTGAVSNSFAMGDVDGGYYTGGLIGYHRSTLSNSFAAGDVSGIYHVGGLIGDHSGPAGSIDFAYALGSVNRNSGAFTDRFGQLVGYCNAGADGQVTNSYYNTTSSVVDPVITAPETNCNSATPARALADAQMLSPGAGLVGFDFVGTNVDDWRYPTTFTKKGSVSVYPYPILYWAAP